MHLQARHLSASDIGLEHLDAACVAVSVAFWVRCIESILMQCGLLLHRAMLVQRLLEFLSVTLAAGGTTTAAVKSAIGHDSDYRPVIDSVSHACVPHTLCGAQSVVLVQALWPRR